MNPLELLMRHRQVNAEIKADPVNIVLQRASTPSKTPAGGYVKSAPASLPPQEVRIILNKRRYNPGLVNSEAGHIPHTDYLLLGRHTLDIEKNDEFEAYGVGYKVVGIQENRTESVLASIDMLGPENRNAG